MNPFLLPGGKLPPRAASGPDASPKGPVPVLVTCDVEIAPDHDRPQQHAALEFLARVHPPASLTLFVTATAAEAFAGELRALAGRGHALGCHGLDHSPAEDYSRLTEAACAARIGAATERIAAALGRRPVVFRGPRMTTSAAAQAALRRLGYVADFSVCPMRLDFGVSPGARWESLGSPRRVYRPAVDNPFREGNADLMVVPLSGFGLPLVSGTRWLLGAGLFRTLFRWVAREAHRNGGPLVSLFHSYEFADLLPGRHPGLPWHQRWYLADRCRRRRWYEDWIADLVQDPAWDCRTADGWFSGQAGRGADDPSGRFARGGGKRGEAAPGLEGRPGS